MRTASDFAIRIHRMTKRFGRVVAVEDLDLTVTPGEVFGFLGPNGAGKSTTIRVLLGLIRPTAGSATVFGDAARDVRQAHRHLAYVPADVALWPTLTGAEILDLLGNVGPASTSVTAQSLSSDSTSTSTDRARPTQPATGRRWRWSLRSPRAHHYSRSMSRPAAWIP
jgi:ABC-type Na+ transport system ATPase subunit NatA